MSKPPEILKLIQEFRQYLGTEEARKHLWYLKEREPRETEEVLKTLSGLPKDSQEFVDLVLYGLLPNNKSKYARRVSAAPAFVNIKKWFARLGYKEEDWTELANLVYELVKRFRERPSMLAELIEEFTSSRLSKHFQCGSLSPVFYALNQSFPIVNSKVIKTYNKIAPLILGQPDKLSQMLRDYPSNVEKLRRFAERLSEEYDLKEVTDTAYLDLFCYWYTQHRKDKHKKAAAPPEPQRRPAEGMPSHAELQSMLLILGGLEGYRAEKEFKINGERLDAVWMRRLSTRPDVAFELQMAGNIYSALVKLKEAWDKWGCISVLVTTEEWMDDARRLLGRAFHEMEKDARLALWTDIRDWHEAAKKRKEVKEKLRIE